MFFEKNHSTVYSEEWNNHAKNYKSKISTYIGTYFFKMTESLFCGEVGSMTVSSSQAKIMNDENSFCLLSKSHFAL